MSKEPPIKLKLNASQYTDIPYIPSYTSTSHTIHMDSTITYNGHDIDSFTLHINNFYEQSQFWRNNLFDLPPGPHIISSKTFYFSAVEKEKCISRIQHFTAFELKKKRRAFHFTIKQNKTKTDLDLLQF